MLKTITAFFRAVFYLIYRLPLQKKAEKLDKAGLIKERDAIVSGIVPSWSQFMVGLTGSTVSVQGEENLPSDTAVVFIANHQGYFDIPVLLGYVNKPKAFISKIEILKVPLISSWMKLMQCTFLDRKNMRQSVEAMHRAQDSVRRGYSLVIFPEGTRSKGGPANEFKAGSFKLAFKAGVPIVPVTINGTYNLYEAHKKLEKGHVSITIHPPVATANLSREETALIPAKVAQTILSALPQA